AYAAGKDDGSYEGKQPQFTASGNKDSVGNFAMQTFGQVTGLSFDGYVGVDFVAFRDIVNALGGVDVCLTGPLDDYQYPDYHDSYVRGGIHFKAGCQSLNGEQALEVARSRHATEGAEASDFGRIKRQQLILNAIRKKGDSVGAIAKAPQLMDALQKNFSTNLTLSDLRILYQWSKGLPDSSIGKLSIDYNNFLHACDRGGYYECSTDPSYGTLHQYFDNLLVDPKVLREKTPVQVANGSHSLSDLVVEISGALGPLGFNVVDPTRVPTAQGSTVYDYSDGKGRATAQWLANYFGARLVEVKKDAPPPTPTPPVNGVVVVLGHQFALRWIGQG
ncbi:MAG: LCP family protein, partial [Candidatus Dormibacteraceae bacterium]